MQVDESFEDEVLQNSSCIGNVESAHVDIDRKKKKKRRRPKNEHEQQALEKVSRLASLYTAALEAARPTSDECKTVNACFDGSDAKSHVTEEQCTSYQLESSFGDDDVSPISPERADAILRDGDSINDEVTTYTPLSPQMPNSTMVASSTEDLITPPARVSSIDEVAPREGKRKKKKDKKEKEVQSSEKVQRFASLYTAALSSTMDAVVMTSTNNCDEGYDVSLRDTSEKQHHEQISGSLPSCSSAREDDEANLVISQATMESDEANLVIAQGTMESDAQTPLKEIEEEPEAEEEPGASANASEKQSVVLKDLTNAPLVASNSDVQEGINDPETLNSLSNEMINDSSGTTEKELVDASVVPREVEEEEEEPTDFLNDIAEALSFRPRNTIEEPVVRVQSTADEVAMTASNVEQVNSLEANNEPNDEDLEGYSFHGVMDLSPQIEEDEYFGPLASDIDKHSLLTDLSVGSLDEIGVIDVSESDEEHASLQDGAAFLEALNAVTASVPMVEVLRPEVAGERKCSEIPVVEPLVPVIDGNASMLDDMMHRSPTAEVLNSISLNAVGKVSTLDDYGGNASMLDDYEDHGDPESPVTPDEESIADVGQMDFAVPPQFSVQIAAAEHLVGGALSKASSSARFVKQPPPPPPAQYPGFLYPDTSMQQQLMLAPQPQLKHVAIAPGSAKDLNHTLDTQVDWSAIFAYQSDEADIPLEIMSDSDDERA